MSIFDELNEHYDEDTDSALVMVDPANALYIDYGAMGVGEYYRDACGCDNEECPGKVPGYAKIITLLLRDIEGNEHTVIVPVESQFASVLLDAEMFDEIRSSLAD